MLGMKYFALQTSSNVSVRFLLLPSRRTAGGCCTCCCGGEGMFNTTLTGPGRVYIQSYSREKFVMALMALGGGGGGKGGGGGGRAPAQAAEMDR